MEIECLGCRATLRVDDKFIGRPARCPHCGYIQTVQNPSEDASVTGEQPGFPGPEKFSREEVRRSVAGPHEFDLPEPSSRGRGVVLLVMGLMGLGCSCPVFSIAAWVMSAKDLDAMRSGHLHSSGQDATRYAYWLGFVGSVLWITIAVVISLVLLIRAGR